MKATVKRKGGRSARPKSLKENRRDVTKAVKATAKSAVKIPKSGKGKMMKAVKVVATVAATAAAVAAGKTLYDASQKPRAKSRTTKRPARKSRKVAGAG